MGDLADGTTIKIREYENRIAELERELRHAKKWKSQCEAYDKAYMPLREAVENALLCDTAVQIHEVLQAALEGKQDA